MSKATSKDGTSIAFEKSGDGPVVILVDGALCYRKLGPMGPIARELASGFTVFTYDLRGRGESEDTAPYSVDREVDDIEALISSFGADCLRRGRGQMANSSVDASDSYFASTASSDNTLPRYNVNTFLNSATTRIFPLGSASP
jgi:hypothetical protein